MVQKKSKYGLNSGGTLRKNAGSTVQGCQSKGRTTLEGVSHYHVDLAYRLVRKLLFDHHNNLLADILRVLQVLSHLPDCSTELSMDKGKRWEMVECLETILSPLTPSYVKQLDAGNVHFPFDFTFEWWNYLKRDSSFSLEALEINSKASADSVRKKRKGFTQSHRGTQRRDQLTHHKGDLDITEDTNGDVYTRYEERPSVNLVLTKHETTTVHYTNSDEQPDEFVRGKKALCKMHKNKQYYHYKGCPWPENDVTPEVRPTRKCCSKSEKLTIVSETRFEGLKRLLGISGVSVDPGSRAPAGQSEAATGGKQTSQDLRQSRKERKAAKIAKKKEKKRAKVEWLAQRQEREVAKEEGAILLNQDWEEFQRWQREAQAYGVGYFASVQVSRSRSGEGAAGSTLCHVGRPYSRLPDIATRSKRHTAADVTVTQRGEQIFQTEVPSSGRAPRRRVGGEVGQTLSTCPLWKFVEDISLGENGRGGVVGLQNCRKGIDCSIVTDEGTTLIANHQQAQVARKALANREPTEGGSSRQYRGANAQGKSMNDSTETMGEDKATRTETKNIQTKKRRKRKKRVVDILTIGSCIGATSGNGFPFYKLASVGLVVQVKHSSMERRALCTRYGDQYQEGDTWPRKFWVDVSGRLRDGQSHVRALSSPRGFLIVETLSVNTDALHSTTDGSDNRRSVPHETVLLHLKCDLDAQGKRELYRLMKSRLRPHLLYPVSKLVDYFVDSHKSLDGQSSSAAQSLKSPLITTLNPLPSVYQFEWLSALCKWNYEIFTGQVADTILQASGQPAGQVRPSSARRLPTVERDTVTPRGQTPSLSPPESVKTARCAVCEHRLLLPADWEHLKIMSATNGHDLDLGQSVDTAVRYVHLPRCNHQVCGRCLHRHVSGCMASAHLHVKCPVENCHTRLDDVTLLWSVSLKRYHGYARLSSHRDTVIHPQWRWCPNPRCDRAVKLSGAGLLDNAVVVECPCGALWCFQCSQRAHWPATCHHSKMASALSLNEDHSATSGTFVIQKSKFTPGKDITAPGHVTHVPHPPSKARGEPTNGIKKVKTCGYVFCPRCLGTVGGVTDVSSAVLAERVATFETARKALLPCVLHRMTLNHDASMLRWNSAAVETRAANLARLVVRSKGTRPAGNHIVHDGRNVNAHRPVLPPVGGRHHQPWHHVAPSMETERLFLLLVQHLTYQAQFLLSNVYKVLVWNKMADRETTEILQLTSKLEKIVFEIDQIMNNMAYSPRIGRLKTLMELGKVTMVSLATQMRRSPGTSVTHGHQTAQLATSRVSSSRETLTMTL